MRALSATLRAAQQSASAAPYLRVQALDMLAGVARSPVTRHTAPSEADAHHAACLAGDGALIRARLASDGTLYVQRTANPGAAASFTGWVNVDSAGTGCNVALCSRGATVILFFVDPLDGVTIHTRTSTDNGATWGSRVPALVPPVTSVVRLAAAFSSGGTPALFFASGAGQVYVSTRQGAFWSTPAAWTNSVASVTGLGCAYTTDWDLAVTGRDSASNRVLWTCVYGDGGELPAGRWSILTEVNHADGGSSVELLNPFLVASDPPRLSYVERHTGASAWQRPYLSNVLAGTTFGQGIWRDPIPIDLDTRYGLALASDATTLWLSSPRGVRSIALGGAAVDLTDDVVALSGRETPAGGRVTVTLRNDDGRYGTPGEGAIAAIRHGSEVRVSPGYVTSAGPEVSDGPAYWIVGWEHRFQGGRAVFVLHAANAWWLLEGWRARRQYTWDAGSASVLGLLAEVLRRVGLTLTASPRSSTIDAHKPQFTISPGERGDAVARRLLALVPDLLAFRGHRGRMRYPRSADATDYAYGAGHPILEGSYGEAAPAHTRVQVYGAAGVAESYAWDEMALLGERLLQHHDLNLDTLSKVRSRGQEIVRQLEREAVSGEITVPVNCGQELYDVVADHRFESRAGVGASAGHRHGARLPPRRAAAVRAAADTGGRVALTPTLSQRARGRAPASPGGEADAQRRVRARPNTHIGGRARGDAQGHREVVQEHHAPGDRAGGGQPGHVAGRRARRAQHRRVGDGRGPVLRRAVLRPRRARGRGGRGGVRVGEKGRTHSADQAATLI